MNEAILPRELYSRSALDTAHDLIGKELVRVAPEGETRGIIVETEAYLGLIDPAAHVYKGKSERVRVLYEAKGLAYIYLIYGMYWCLNLCAGEEGKPECVLIRALDPVAGLELMAERRGTKKLTALCSGPGKLSMAMGITGKLYGADLCDVASGLYVTDVGLYPEIEASKRINIDYAGPAKEHLWRFTAAGSGFVSVRR